MSVWILDICVWISVSGYQCLVCGSLNIKNIKKITNTSYINIDILNINLEHYFISLVVKCFQLSETNSNNS